ncbi:hypothetical protein PAAG_12078 [Paracoccidioides lutzii Pb01]|uniref:Uncharacterized protein n=1 Tax=Paracoccidioides lutzii (strain ATCC MYA-826 / Pb01) TaxID=502779 RepID=A0A0A2V529_PARBA|nr:hypothetical protein PAAG_12078 [Paracoccidioides lutzii Pb01]KGQ01220.1 hypothetical protein PAAG_12078 [Paracoccidioides lutzii Pb01]
MVASAGCGRNARVATSYADTSRNSVDHIPPGDVRNSRAACTDMEDSSPLARAPARGRRGDKCDGVLAQHIDLDSVAPVLTSSFQKVYDQTPEGSSPRWCLA